MSINKPYHRNHRGIKTAPNSGYSNWAYIIDKNYAKNPQHYIRAFLMIQDDLKNIFEFIEPADECAESFSFRIHALLMRTCIEIEANFKAILDENTFTASKNRPLNMATYRKIDVTHHLSSFEISLPIWHGGPKIMRPFSPWYEYRGVSRPGGVKLPWYASHNDSKHDRQEKFRQASFSNLIEAVSALAILISSQFLNEDFSAASRSIALEGYDYHDMEPCTGDLFRIKHPDDWNDDEIYDFDWSDLGGKPDRFQKIDYDAII